MSGKFAEPGRHAVPAKSGQRRQKGRLNDLFLQVMVAFGTHSARSQTGLCTLIRSRSCSPAAQNCPCQFPIPQQAQKVAMFAILRAVGVLGLITGARAQVADQDLHAQTAVCDLRQPDSTFFKVLPGKGRKINGDGDNKAMAFSILGHKLPCPF